MKFLHAFHAETLKIKRTLALKMVVIAPLAVILLTLFMASQAPYSTVRRVSTADVWPALARVNFQFWGLLMLPLYVTLQTALIAGIDHADNQWKALFARPVARSATYLAKLLLILLMLAASATLLAGGIVAEGLTLNALDSKIGFHTAPPIALIATQAAQMTVLAFLFLTIQHWVSLRWRSFSVAIGFGIVAVIASFAMLLAAGPYGTWPQYFPWSLPMLVLAKHPPEFLPLFSLTVAAGILATFLGCIEFSRREIS